jgi:hypothetical protein
MIVTWSSTGLQAALIAKNAIVPHAMTLTIWTVIGSVSMEVGLFPPTVLLDDWSHDHWFECVITYLFSWQTEYSKGKHYVFLSDEDFEEHMKTDDQAWMDCCLKEYYRQGN